MEFEFVENFYDTIKSRARVAAIRKNTNVHDVDENKKKRKTIRRNNLKNKAKSSLKSKGKVRRRKVSKETDLTPTKQRERRSNSNKKTPSPKKAPTLVNTTNNNDIDEEEAAYILCGMSTITQRSFDSFYNRFPLTIDNKIEIPIINTVDNFNNVVAFNQPYSHILLDHNYWSLNNQPEIKFELKIEHSNSIPVSTATTTTAELEVPVHINKDQPDPQKSIEKSIDDFNEKEFKSEIKQQLNNPDILVGKIDDENKQQQQPEVNNNLLAESLLVSSIVKQNEEEKETKIAAATMAVMTTATVKQKRVVKKKEKCRKILSSNNSKRKTQNKKIKQRKEKNVTLSNGFAANVTTTARRMKAEEKVESDEKNSESPVPVEKDSLSKPLQNHDKTTLEPSSPISISSSTKNPEDIVIAIKTEENGSNTATTDDEDLKKEMHFDEDGKSNGHVDSIDQESPKNFDDELDENVEVDERCWSLICDFHGTILDKLTSNNVRFCGDISDSKSTAMSSSSSSVVRILGSMNNYQTASDSRNYESNNDYYTSHRLDYNNRYDPVTNCEYKRPYANYRTPDSRSKYPYNFNNRDNNRHRKEQHFYRHHSYCEGINNQQTYASYKAQKTFGHNRQPSLIDSGNQAKQTVSVFELPVNGANSIVKDLMPIIERKEFMRSKSVADPRLASIPNSETDKFPNPKKKVNVMCVHNNMKSTYLNFCIIALPRSIS